MSTQNQTQTKRRGRPSKKVQNVTYVPSIINFDKIDKLKNIQIDPKMLETMESGLPLDNLISHEGGTPCATNIMIIGDPGAGKTTISLDLLSGIKKKNNNKCLFISGEMGRKQMFKYTERFKQFGIVETLFMRDYSKHNTKDVIEQVLDQGWDCILVDSVAEVLDGVREDNGWDRKLAESWLVDICEKNNVGENKLKLYTTFLLIQQVTKGGVFVGSNKLKHMTDALMEIRQDKKEGSNYINFQKNRNGSADIKFGFQLSNNQIVYGTMVNENSEEE